MLKKHCQTPKRRARRQLTIQFRLQKRDLIMKPASKRWRVDLSLFIHLVVFRALKKSMHKKWSAYLRLFIHLVVFKAPKKPIQAENTRTRTRQSCQKIRATRLWLHQWELKGIWINQRDTCRAIPKLVGNKFFPKFRVKPRSNLSSKTRNQSGSSIL